MNFRIFVIPSKGEVGNHSQSLIFHLLQSIILIEASVAKCSEAGKDNGVHVCVRVCLCTCVCACTLVHMCAIMPGTLKVTWKDLL